MIKKIIHSADWHLYLYKRHEEFKEVIDKMCSDSEQHFKELEYNERLFVIAGDIFHDFTKSSNESRELLGTILRQMADIARIVIIAGNHDFNENNINEMDSITPVIELLNDDRIFYYKESECVEFDENILFAVYSVFDHCNPPKNIPQSDRTIVGLYHAPLKDAQTDINTKIFENFNVDTSIFNGCDVVMMGDIHKYQVLYNEHNDKKIECVYSSSLVQQNFGENVEGHGYVLWDMESLTHKFVPIKVDYGYFKLKIKSSDDVENNKEVLMNGKLGKTKKIYNIPKNGIIKIIWEDYPHNINNKLKKEIRSAVSKKYNIPLSQIEAIKVKYIQTEKDQKKISTQLIDNISNDESLLDLYLKYLSENYELTNDDKSFFQELDNKVNTQLEILGKKEIISGDKREWKILNVKAENFLSFEKLERDFESNGGGICLINSNPANQGGKSNLTRVLMFLIYGSFYYGDNKSKFEKIFNKFLNSDESTVSGELRVKDEDYYLYRKLKRNRENGKITHTFKIYKYDDKGTETINGRSAISLNKKDAQKSKLAFQKNIGKIEDFIFTSMFDSLNIESWIETKPTKRFNLFSEYLGLKKFEFKHDVIKSLYKDFIKSSKLNSFSIEDLKTEKETLANEKKYIEQDLIGLSNMVNSLNNEIQLIEKQKEGEYKKYKSTNTKTNLSIEELKALEIQYNDKINKFKGLLVDLNQSIGDNDVPSLKESVNLLNKQMLDIVVDEMLIVRRSILKNSIANESYVIKDESTNLLQILEEAETELHQTTAEYNQIKKTISEHEIELNELPEELVCNNCGNVVQGGEVYKQQLLDKIISLKANLKEITEKGKICRLKVNEFKAEISSRKNAVIEELNSIELQISEAEKSIKKEYQKQIIEKNNLIDKISQRSNISNEISICEQKLKEIKQDIEIYETSKDVFAYNEKIDSKIKQLNGQKEIFTKNKFTIEKEISSLTGRISFIESSLIEKDSILEEISLELQKDKIYKIYQEMHGTGGLAKHIILSVLPRINAELEEIISDVCDFNLFIDFNDKGIEFMVEKDGVQYELYMCSGLEKTISCLALHYVNMKISTLPTPNVLILDEIFSGVSNDNLENVFSIIETLLDVFTNIDLITHREEVGNYAQNIITVNKNKNISSIKIIKNS